LPATLRAGDLHYGHGEAGTHAPGISQRQMLEVEINVLDKNNQIAARNRARFAARKQLVLNLVSSPGSGKTTLLTETLKRLNGRVSCAVIEGDQQTVNDAARIRETGTPAIQVNTGKGCHLDAQMIADAARVCRWRITAFCLLKTSATWSARRASISANGTRWRCCR
jgi:hydrogenase nickel incorporation protein HypB